VLVDAPCSGLGVIGRRADARFRKREGDPERFALAQAEILARASERVADRGRLLYVTCSTHAAEDEDVVDGFVRDHPEWERSQLKDIDVPDALRIGSGLLTVPGIDGADGFFFAKLVKRRADARPAERQPI